MNLDWFEKLTGFREGPYEETRAKLEVSGRELRSKVNDKQFGIGVLELVTLGELRERVAERGRSIGKLRFSKLVGDVRKLHHAPEHQRALFQVASQFNLLEMVGPNVTPEDGVTRYAGDPTQGPACAIAAGAATIYRNYFARVGDQLGQTAERQLDGLADLGAALSEAVGRPVSALWRMQNGYALCTAEGLAAINGYLRELNEPGRDRLRAFLRIGVHRDVEVTDDAQAPGQLVTQAFCSALPVAYAGHPRRDWAAFAQLVLEAAYEATLLEGVLNANRGASNIVLLTRLGGGAFGNEDTWINAALIRALRVAANHDLDVRLVSYGSVPPGMRELEASWPNPTGVPTPTSTGRHHRSSPGL